MFAPSNHPSPLTSPVSEAYVSARYSTATAASYGSAKTRPGRTRVRLPPPLAAMIDFSSAAGHVAPPPHCTNQGGWGCFLKGFFFSSSKLHRFLGRCHSFLGQRFHFFNNKNLVSLIAHASCHFLQLGGEKSLDIVVLDVFYVGRR